MITKETDVEMLQKIFPEESPDISTLEKVLCSCRMEHWHTHRRWLWIVVEGSVSRETDLAEVRIHLVPTFTRSEPLRFLFLGLFERLNQEIIPATISRMREQVKNIIESIPAEILQRVIGDFNRRI